MNMEEIDTDIEAQENNPEDNEGEEGYQAGKKSERGTRVPGMDRSSRLQGFEIDDQLGIDPADLDKLIDADESLITTEDYTDIREPHYLFDTAVLAKALFPLASIIKDGQELVPKTMLMESEPGIVKFKVNTGEFIGEIKVPVLNKQNQIENQYVLEFKTLNTVVRNSGSRMVIVEKDKQITVRVLGGEVEFEQYSIDRSTYNKIPPEIETKGVVVPGDLFQIFVSRAMRVMPLATRSEDRRVRVEADLAFASYLTSLVSFPGLGSEVAFRASDLTFLSRILEGVATVRFYADKEWNYFLAPSFKIGLPPTNTDDIQTARKYFEALEKVSNFTLTPAQFGRVLNMIRNIVGASSVIRLRITDGKLYVAATTSTGKKLEFPVATAQEGDQLDVTINSSTLVSIATLMKKDTTTSVAISKDGKLLFESDAIRILLGQFL